MAPWLILKGKTLAIALVNQVKVNMKLSSRLYRYVIVTFDMLVTKNHCVTLKIREYASFVSNRLAYVISIMSP